MKIIKFTLLLIAVVSCAYSETKNIIDNGYKAKDVETGLHFYEDPQKEQKTTLQKSNVEKLLEQIANELKNTKEEVKELKEFTNPNAPHYITNAKGEKCLANSSPDCIDIPVIQEARNVPAMYKWIKEPTIENAANYLKVQAQFFNHWNDMGYSLRFAALNGGTEVYPVDSQDSLEPINDFNKDKYKDAILNEMKKRRDILGTLIFLGINEDVEDYWGKEKLSRLAYKKGQYLNIALVFHNKESKEKYDNFYKNTTDSDLKNVYFGLPKFIDQTAFSNYNINITPSAVAVYNDKKNNKNISAVISKGFIQQSSVIYGQHNFLVFNKIVKPETFNAENTWHVDMQEDKK